MINYTWKIHSLTKRTINAVNNVVFTVVWEKFGITDDGYSGSVKSAANFNIVDIEEEKFVPYEQLTEEILIEWVKNFIDEESINKGIEQEIEKAKSQWIQVNDGEFPWNIVAETLPDPLADAFSEPDTTVPDPNFDMNIYSGDTSTGIGTT